MDRFFQLIDQLNSADQADKAALEQHIWQQFGVNKVILALDMSGFSLTTRRQGIVTYLAKIRRMQQMTAPLVTQYHGEVIKFVADNLMACFDDCQQAVEAALAIRATCLQAEQKVSMGLDYGRVLLIPHKDCYGDAVNRAYKLGEDIAEANEILISDEVYQRLNNKPAYKLTHELISISGIEISTYHIERLSTKL